MVAYHLCRQTDGRIVLDREIHGAVRETIEVDDPPLVWRPVDGEWTKVPAYSISYAEARAKVGTDKFDHVRGEGWFKDRVLSLPDVP